MNGLKCVVPENIHTTPTDRICHMPPSPRDFSKISPQNLPQPLPSGISKIFAHPLETLLSLIEVNKEVVLFARMPNFVSFMYFLLNCITDRQIPYANTLCAQVTKKLLKKFLATRKFKARSQRKYNSTFHLLHQEESKTWRSINKEIRTVWVSNFVLTKFAYMCIWVCGKIAHCWFHL